MGDPPLRASEAARALGISTRDVLVLMRKGDLRYVMRDGIAHVPADAIEDDVAAAS